MKKTILYLRTDISDKPLVVGGSVTHTIGVIQGLLASGYHVVCGASVMQEILCIYPAIDFLRLVVPRWIGVFRWKISCILSTFLFAFQLRSAFKKYSFDYLYQRYSPFNATGILLSWWYQVPLILEYNGSEVWVFKNWVGARRFKMLWLLDVIERLNTQYAQCIVVVSDVLKKELVKRGVVAQKIVVAPNGVDTDIYDPGKLVTERIRVRTELNLEGKCVFGFVGTFSYWHGIELLAQLIPQIITQRAQVHFILIGDGPLHPFLKEALSRAGCLQSVTFTGLLLTEQARSYLVACDAFLCPTQQNPDGTDFFGSPTKLFEYLSMGKPIVASRLGQVAEIVTVDVGFLLEPTDVLGFLSVCIQLIDMDVIDKKRLGDNARNMAVTRYTWNSHVRLIMNQNKSMVQC